MEEFICDNKLDFTYSKNGLMAITKYKIAKNCYLALCVCWKEFAYEVETSVLGDLVAYFCDDMLLLKSNKHYFQTFQKLKTWKAREALTDKFWNLVRDDGMGYDKILFKNLCDDLLSILEICLIQKDGDLVSKLFMIINCILSFKEGKENPDLKRFTNAFCKILKKYNK